MDIDTTNKKEQRKFGLVMAGAFTVLALIRWALHRGTIPTGFLVIAAAFLVLGLVAPRVLRPVLFVWLKFALALNWFMTRVLLTTAFLGMIVPARILIRLFSTDPLKRAWDPEAPTYWEEPEDQPEELERYLNQF